MRDALKEKLLFEKITLKNEEQIQAYRSKMRGSQLSNKYLKGTYDSDGNYIAFEIPEASSNLGDNKGSYF